MKESLIFRLAHPVLLMTIFLPRSSLMYGSLCSHTESIPRGAQDSINVLIESILRQINPPKGNPNVVVHINNLYCVSDSQNVQINPCKQQIINVAHGDQVVSLDGSRDLAKRSTKDPSSKISKSDETKTSSVECKGRDCGNGQEKEVQSDQPWIRPMAKSIGDGCRKVDLPQSIETKKSEFDSTEDSYHLDVPALNIFIDGKPLQKSKPRTYSSEELSSKLFKEELKELLFEHDKNSVGKRLLCHSDDAPPCDDETVTLRTGLELSYDSFGKIIDNVSERPNFVKLIVPGGVTGPLSGYFQKVDKSLHEHALVHGVCLLDNGLLVPLRAMLMILKLHAWLCEMAPHFGNEDVSKLHSSVKSKHTDGIVDLLRCFVKSNKIQVSLPGTNEVSFAQFEQEDEHIPMDLLKLATVKILGFHIPYIVFRDKLVALCRETSN